jgi:hypothetical protein
LWGRFQKSLKVVCKMRRGKRMILKIEKNDMLWLYRD